MNRENFSYRITQKKEKNLLHENGAKSRTCKDICHSI